MERGGWCFIWAGITRSTPSPRPCARTRDAPLIPWGALTMETSQRRVGRASRVSRTALGAPFAEPEGRGTLTSTRQGRPPGERRGPMEALPSGAPGMAAVPVHANSGAPPRLHSSGRPSGHASAAAAKPLDRANALRARVAASLAGPGVRVSPGTPPWNGGTPRPAPASCRHRACQAWTACRLWKARGSMLSRTRPRIRAFCWAYPYAVAAASGASRAARSRIALSERRDRTALEPGESGGDFRSGMGVRGRPPGIGVLGHHFCGASLRWILSRYK